MIKTFRGYGHVLDFAKLNNRIVRIKVKEVHESTYEQYDPSTIVVEFKILKEGK